MEGQKKLKIGEIAAAILVIAAFLYIYNYNKQNIINKRNIANESFQQQLAQNKTIHDQITKQNAELNKQFTKEGEAQYQTLIKEIDSQFVNTDKDCATLKGRPGIVITDYSSCEYKIQAKGKLTMAVPVIIDKDALSSYPGYYKYFWLSNYRTLIKSSVVTKEFFSKNKIESIPACEYTITDGKVTPSCAQDGITSIYPLSYYFNKYLKKEAAKYNADVTLDIIPIGPIISPEKINYAGWEPSLEIDEQLEKIAKDYGFDSSKYDMTSYVFLSYIKGDSSAAFRSHALRESHKTFNNIVLSSSLDLSVIIHETFHLFGANDKYVDFGCRQAGQVDPFGKKEDNLPVADIMCRVTISNVLSELSQSWYKESIVNKVTAREIGWSKD